MHKKIGVVFGKEGEKKPFIKIGIYLFTAFWKQEKKI